MATVKVRVAVSIAPNGQWYASGCSDSDMTHGDVEEFGDLDEGCGRYWLTAELDIPEAKEVAAAVESAK